MEKNKTKLITERIKTFDDALKEVGRLAYGGNNDLAILLADYELNVDNIYTKGVLAYMKLCIIAAALNEGWVPKYKEEEYRWYCRFVVWRKEELQNKSDAWIKEHNIYMFGGHSYDASLCGLAFGYSSLSWFYSSLHCSACIALKNSELAEYCGKQFIDIWAEYIFG